MLITYVDLAKLKEVSKSAVSQRKAKGLFKGAIVKTVNGKDYLDKDAALKAWDGIVDDKQIIKHENIDMREVKKELIDTVDKLPIQEIPDFNISRAKKMHYDAALAEIEVKVKEGTYVDAKETEKKGFELAKSLSDKLMTLPDRVSSLFAAETDQSVIGKTLKDEIVLAINSSIKQFA